MRRFVVIVTALLLTLAGPTATAKADEGRTSRQPPKENPSIDYSQPISKLAIKSSGPPLQPMTHDQFKTWGAISGASLTSGPHCPGTVWLCLDYAKSQSADTLYWSNNKALSGTVTSLGPYALYQGKDAGGNVIYPDSQGRCPDPIPTGGSLGTFSHNEVAAHVESTYTDLIGSQWTFVNEYWHMGSVSTGTKANGDSIGAQATHPIGGCKYYSWGQLASTGPHIHHQGQYANTYTDVPIAIIWQWPSH